MKPNPPVKQERQEKDIHEISSSVVRIATTDIPGETTVYNGLRRIKGISWGISNAVCHKLELDKKRKINTLSEQEIEKILKLIASNEFPEYLVNRRKDIASGSNKHLITADLDLQRDFDIRAMKKIRSYKGWRHAMGQPVRGQRTKSHFRKGKSLGVTRIKAKPAKEGKK